MHCSSQQQPGFYTAATTRSMPETSGGALHVQGTTRNAHFQDVGGYEQLVPPAVHCHPMSVFLAPQYRNLSLFEVKGEEDAQRQAEALQQLRAQRAVERFLNDGCLLRAAATSVGGGLLGRPLQLYVHGSTGVKRRGLERQQPSIWCPEYLALRFLSSFPQCSNSHRHYTTSTAAGIVLGAFFFTMKPVDVDNSLGLRAQLRQQYKSFIPEVTATAKNFAKIGGLYSLAECIVDKARATHDLRGAIYGGCLTGAALAVRGGPRAMAIGSLGFGAFAAAMEMLQPLIGFDV